MRREAGADAAFSTCATFSAVFASTIYSLHQHLPTASHPLTPYVGVLFFLSGLVSIALCAGPDARATLALYLSGSPWSLHGRHPSQNGRRRRRFFHEALLGQPTSKQYAGLLPYSPGSVWIVVLAWTALALDAAYRESPQLTLGLWFSHQTGHRRTLLHSWHWHHQGDQAHEWLRLHRV